VHSNIRVLDVRAATSQPVFGLNFGSGPLTDWLYPSLPWGAWNRHFGAGDEKLRAVLRARACFFPFALGTDIEGLSEAPRLDTRCEVFRRGHFRFRRALQLDERGLCPVSVDRAVNSPHWLFPPPREIADSAKMRYVVR